MARLRAVGVVSYLTASNWLLVLAIFIIVTLIQHGAANQSERFPPDPNSECFIVIHGKQITLTCSRPSSPDKVVTFVKSLVPIAEAKNVIYEIVQLNLTDVSEDQVKHIFGSDLPKRIVLGQLTRLVLRSCNLTSLPSQDGTLKNLLERFPALELLDLENNNLISLGPEVDLSATNLSRIHLDNSWNCQQSEWIDNANQIRPSLQDKTEEIRCSSPEALRGMSMQQVRSVEETPVCSECVCYVINKALAVDCGGRNLTTIPVKLPVNTKIVSLENNNIEHMDFPVGSSDYWTPVLKLYLNNNSISSLDALKEPKLFANLRTLHIDSVRFIYELLSYV